MLYFKFSLNFFQGLFKRHSFLTYCIYEKNTDNKPIMNVNQKKTHLDFFNRQIALFLNFRYIFSRDYLKDTVFSVFDEKNTDNKPSMKINQKKKKFYEISLTDK